MAVTDADLGRAEARMQERMRASPKAVAARYDRRISRIVVSLDTGLELALPPHRTEGLEKAKPADLAEIEISPTGLGLHFPRLDADLYVPALLEGVLGSRRWMAAQLGRAGGKSRSAGKAAAARANGRLGGRPRKTG